MKDIDIIKKLSASFKIEIPELDSYSWGEVGYTINSEGRVEVLNLHAIPIKKLPKYIGAFSELKVLHVVGCELTSIDETSSLNKLKIIAIQANKIKNISVFKNFTCAEEIYLSYNPIRDISSLTELKNIKKLEMSDIPVANTTPIGSLIHLQIATFSGEHIADPSFLLNCHELTNLAVWNLEKTTPIPPLLYDCLKNSKLQRLSFGRIISADIKRIAELSSITYLDIYDSHLISINEISKMTQLQRLNLRNCHIEDINGISKLQNLQHLDLSENNIEDITPFKKLQSLKTLILRKNRFSNLEPLMELGMKFVYDSKSFYASENEINISECNEITNPPIEIVKQGNEAILRYFKRIDEEGLDYIFEAKLILVGEGSAGKTSLQIRLINEKAALPEGDNRTRGINIVDFEFTKEKNIRKTVHIWDFGGQDVYYPVHRFFITENAVFVLLASTRQLFHNFDYWIPTIFQFGGKSPIIVGQTCHQGNAAPWNELDSYFSNPNFNIIKTLETPYYKLDLPNNNSGLDTIKASIINQIENLHHFGKGVPKSWGAIRKQLILEANSKSCIPFQTFIEICKQQKNFDNLQDIEDCCDFFHDIGVILWYSQIEELKDWVILEPQWAMGAVYKIIDDAEIQKRNGIIQPLDFDRLWNIEIYEGKYSLLKKLLINFKIAFPTKHNRGEFIIPARLSSLPNELKWELQENCLRLEYTFEFMPRGIINQLTADLSRYIYKYEVWNNAVNFAYESSNTKSQVIEDSYNRKLSIVSKGGDARGMNILIMDSMRNIIDSYKGVKEEIYVKCLCSICQTIEKPTTFLYLKLVDWSSKRENATVTCNESGEALKISELLYEVGFGKSFKNEKLQQTNKTITIFLASSQELHNDRKEFELFINRENKQLHSDGVFLKLEVYEDFVDMMSKTRLQEEYNTAAINSDIFVSLFWTKVGKYSSEEFGKAWDSFKVKGKPFIYTYFNNSSVTPSGMTEKDTKSKFKFLKALNDLGHYPTYYENIDDLKHQFKMQLQKIMVKLL